MSLLRTGATKLKLFSPLTKQTVRNYNYGFTHVIGGPPTVRMPFAEKMFMGFLFCSAMFSYPLYVTYMMPIWDEMDGNA